MRCGPRYDSDFRPLGRQHWRRLCTLVLLLSLFSKTLSIFGASNALHLGRSLFTPFVLLFSSTWHLPMQLPSGKL
ncbi:uncharacterized protein HD556DRAFT_1386872 [Suillus plorans]|uniref:Uncharacterized protein n=1 Tax=Suillus plorans TaxID=116603 RepID=A0A9P7DFE1_9AGAM|nr:uncharacterized protein HD556DRAFT_1386872 [Suillus plorans]KAG1791241.1 hypothetical protein HD556DRAFT_1386872 [Suillus plorans]